MAGRVSSKALIVNSDGKFLVLTNSNMGFRTHVAYRPDFPGGAVEAGESITDALIREVKEEIGIDITHAPRKTITTCSLPHTDYTIVMHLVWANIRDFALDAEHCAFNWMTLQQMKQLDWWAGYKGLFDEVEQLLQEADTPHFGNYCVATSCALHA